MTTDKKSIVIATLALIVALGVAIFGISSINRLSTSFNELAVSLSSVQSTTGEAGTRFPHGLIVGNGTAPVANELVVGTQGTSTFGGTGTPFYYRIGGVYYADVEQSFTTATNTPIIIPNPFGTATTTFAHRAGIKVQITGGGPAIEFDISTTSLSNFATSTAVLVKDIAVSNNATYDGTFYPNVATSSLAGNVLSIPTGVLPGVSNATNHQGETLWFLRGGTQEGIMLKIASTTVAGSVTGTVSVTFSKP